MAHSAVLGLVVAEKAEYLHKLCTEDEKPRIGEQMGVKSRAKAIQERHKHQWVPTH